MSVHFTTLERGDLFWAELVLDPADIAYRSSGTARKIRNKVPLPRICIVLQKYTNCIGATYLATFDEALTLPPGLDRRMWYPFKPAESHGSYSSLAAQRNKKAQWASLRSVHYVYDQYVEKLGIRLPAASVDAIQRAMQTAHS